MFNTTCQPFGTRFKHFSSSYQKISDVYYLYNLAFKLAKDMGTELKIRYWIDIKPKFAKKSLRCADEKFELCNLFRSNIDVPAFRFVWHEVARSGHLPSRCPVKAVSMIFFSFG